MSVKYQHTQRGGFGFYFAIVLFSVLLVFLIIDAVNGKLQDADRIALWAVPLIGGYVILMMSGLTVTIDKAFIRIRFGPGVFWKTYSLATISDCRPVWNGWWWGYGIRWYFRGWLYNIAGFEAVEITFKSGKKIRIGTDQPDMLTQAVKQAIQ
jgi:hypothetical protein